jgi:hypothetical protein
VAAGLNHRPQFIRDQRVNKGRHSPESWHRRPRERNDALANVARAARGDAPVARHVMEAAYSEAERPFQRSSSDPPAILQQFSSAGCQAPPK